MSPIHQMFYLSAIGFIKVEGSEKGVSSVEFLKKADDRRATEVPGDAPACLGECVKQLDEYFAGARKTFSIRLDLQGTAFQTKSWRALLRIPYGRTVSYRDIAVAVGNRKATRAVGGANHRNPASIIVPCHRVVGVDGSLTGYGGGLWRKKWLLDHERRHSP